MSFQIFLQGRILGIDKFLLASSSASLSDLDGRAHWAALLSEVLPRALLAELGLPKILLGSSGGDQFLLILPGEARDLAGGFLKGAADHLERLSEGTIKLLWSLTENLGDWTVVRKRLNEEMQQKLGTPARDHPAIFGAPVDQACEQETADYFTAELGRKLREAETVGWSPETPASVRVGEGKHVWPLSASADGISYARHAALADDGITAAGLDALAARATGRKAWGVLRGDVDNFGIRIRRAQSIEEHIQLSVMYKQFFAGELEVLCSLPEFWRKVTLLYSGGDDFAVYGAWDSLVALAREVQRLFHRFADENLKEFPGPEGKTISMAVAVARGDVSLAGVYEEAGHGLESAKSSGKDCFWLLGRALEWKYLGDAMETKAIMVRLVKEFGSSTQFLYELAGFYRDGNQQPGTRRSKNTRVDKPWRFHRRLNLVLGSSKDKEFQKLRSSLVLDFTGRNAALIRLRPAGRVALEWAHLETENHSSTVGAAQSTRLETASAAE